MWYKLLIILSLTLLASGCGMHDDQFGCMDLCDESRRCSPNMSDADWDECYANCDESQTPTELIDCIVEQNCRNSIETMTKNCYYDPMKAD